MIIMPVQMSCGFVSISNIFRTPEKCWAELLTIDEK